MSVENDPEIILSIDGSGEKNSLLIACEKRKLGEWSEKSQSSKTEDILARAEAILKAHRLKKQHIRTIIVSKNESPTTGGKIAAAIAKGLARAFGCRLAAVPLAESLLNEAKEGADGEYVTVVPFGKHQVRWDLFRKQKGIFTKTDELGVFEKGKMPDNLAGTDLQKVVFAVGLGDRCRTEQLLPCAEKYPVFQSVRELAELNLNYYENASDNVKENFIINADAISKTL